MSCKKCGECCKYVAVMVPDVNDPDGEAWSDAHNHIRVAVPGGVMLFIPNRCNFLSSNNECLIYENRPKGCKLMPTWEARHYHPPECRYFEEDVCQKDTKK